MAEKSLTISFSIPSSETLISLSLDDVANQGVTSFEITDVVYLKFLSASNASFIVERSSGIGSIVGENIYYPIEEEVQFIHTNEASLSHIPVSGVTWDWVGISGGTPLFNNEKVTVPNEVTAVLKCIYSTKGSRLSLMSSAVGTVLVVVTQGTGDDAQRASLSVAFAASTTDPAIPVAYELEVKDFCNDDILSGVEVYLNGSYKGLTDANGIINLGLLFPGTTHTLKMVRDGYENSDEDNLNNDSFVVA